jgi:hypothetical protein
MKLDGQPKQAFLTKREGVTIMVHQSPQEPTTILFVPVDSPLRTDGQSFCFEASCLVAEQVL